MPTKAELLEACAASGQMDSRQVAAHVEAGEMEWNRCGCNHWLKLACPANNCPWQGKRPVDRAATPLPTYHQQEKK